MNKFCDEILSCYANLIYFLPAQVRYESVFYTFWILLGLQQSQKSFKDLKPSSQGCSSIMAWNFSSSYVFAFEQNSWLSQLQESEKSTAVFSMKNKNQS